MGYGSAPCNGPSSTTPKLGSGKSLINNGTVIAGSCGNAATLLPGAYGKPDVFCIGGPDISSKDESSTTDDLPSRAASRCRSPSSPTTKLRPTSSKAAATPSAAAAPHGRRHPRPHHEPLRESCRPPDA